MKKKSFIFMALVIFATSAPTLALAQYEHEVRGNQGNATILTIFSLTLYFTATAILGVVAFSIWKLYVIRRKTSKMRSIQSL